VTWYSLDLAFKQVAFGCDQCGHLGNVGVNQNIHHFGDVLAGNFVDDWFANEALAQKNVRHKISSFLSYPNL
jgi:hypothetical protein